MSIDWQIQVLGSVPSTQDVAMDAMINGATEGLTIQAMTMESGRGRHGHKWEAPMGNLYLSTLLRPRCNLEEAGDLSFVVAVALYKTLSRYINSEKHKITLKWPNDVLVDGLKISGILLETNTQDNTLDGVVVGIGVNVFNAPDLAINLEKLSKNPVYINKIRDDLLENLNIYYALWQEEGIAPIRLLWLKNAHGLGQAISARLPNKTYKGIFEGLSEEGALILKDENNERHIIHAADVYFGDAS